MNRIRCLKHLEQRVQITIADINRGWDSHFTVIWILFGTFTFRYLEAGHLDHHVQEIREDLQKLKQDYPEIDSKFWKKITSNR